MLQQNLKGAAQTVLRQIRFCFVTAESEPPPQLLLGKRAEADSHECITHDDTTMTVRKDPTCSVRLTCIAKTASVRAAGAAENTAMTKQIVCVHEKKMQSSFCCSTKDLLTSQWHT